MTSGRDALAAIFAFVGLQVNSPITLCRAESRPIYFRRGVIENAPKEWISPSPARVYRQAYQALGVRRRERLSRAIFSWPPELHLTVAEKRMLRAS
jgi:hypothetical protein